MTKGQIFSLDFLIAVSILILGIGLLMNSVYLSTYEAKEKLEKRNLSEKAEAGLTALFSNANAGCDVNGHYAAHSINLSKLDNLTSTDAKDIALKKALGLGDMNVSLEVGGNQKINDGMNLRNIYAVEIDVMACENSSVTFTALRNCMNGASCAGPITQKKLKIRVG